ncbi:hypothetical protein [Micromonospora sp. CB01531]|uniref:hypothetical protein n=1 Tax=Micromonospora sp. CB01531 TaxID=1718947 RepID=UPI000939433F|nr:hypothetical protein [Micromonospora sp. CB01531]OKI73901.1 hypothetical protein A6A27_19350 [Micromonospora sp. CB01531]
MPTAFAALSGEQEVLSHKVICFAARYLLPRFVNSTTATAMAPVTARQSTPAMSANKIERPMTGQLTGYRRDRTQRHRARKR